MKNLIKTRFQVVLLAVIAAGVTNSAYANEYRLSAETLRVEMEKMFKDIVLEEPTTDDLNKDFKFTADGVDWTLNVVSSNDCINNGAWIVPDPSGLRNGFFMFFNYYFALNVTLTAHLPVEESILSADCTMVMCNSSGASQNYTCYAGGEVKTYSNTSPRLAFIKTEGNSAEEVHFNFDNAITNRVSIQVETEKKSEFAFKEFVINTQLKTLAPEMLPTVPVGHTLMIHCDDEGAALFYRLNDPNGEWQAYSPERGVTLNEAGTHLIEYYAHSSGMAQSRVQSTEIHVVTPSGIDAVKARCMPISVSGVVVGQGNGYTLIGHNVNSDAADCIAIANSDYPALASAVLGTPIEATGRPTDRFAHDGIGSLSSLTIDGIVSQPITTGRATISRTDESQPTHYDLHGRKVSDTRTSAPRILITDKGTKILKR